MHACGQSHCQPLAEDADDSSLEALLASLLRGALPAGEDCRKRGHFIPTNRLSRFGLGGPTTSVRADFDRLAEELTAEYQRLVLA